jgi:hypothetical protein
MKERIVFHFQYPGGTKIATYKQKKSASYMVVSYSVLKRRSISSIYTGGTYTRRTIKKILSIRYSDFHIILK